MKDVVAMRLSVLLAVPCYHLSMSQVEALSHLDCARQGRSCILFSVVYSWRNVLEGHLGPKGTEFFFVGNVLHMIVNNRILYPNMFSTLLTTCDRGAVITQLVAGLVACWRQVAWSSKC